MQDFVGKWITIKDFAGKQSFNVFHRQLDVQEYPSDFPQNKHILFRKRFNAGKHLQAILRISADDYYKLYINGEFVTQGVAPCYFFKQYYNEIDISSYLKEGENTIAVHTYYFGVPNRVCVSGDLQHGLIFDLYLDNNLVLCTDETFKCCYHDGYTSEHINKHKTQFMEIYDSRSKAVGFEKPEYDDSSWENAKEREYAGYTLVKQPTKQLDVYQITPKVIKKTNNGYFIDIGREIVGNLCLSAQGVRGDTLVVRYGEELDDNGNVRYELRCKCHYEEKWILSGKKDQLDFWDYKAFRYVELIVPSYVLIYNLNIKIQHYPYKEIRSYCGNDEKEMAVFNLCRDTVKYGVLECYVDCPTREKGQYFLDAIYAGLAQIALTDDSTMFYKMIDNAFDTACVDTCLMAAGPNAYMQEIAEYPFAIICACWAVYCFTEDKKLLKEHFCKAKILMEEIQKRYVCDNGLLKVKDKWNVVDWPANLRDGYDCDLTQRQECEEQHNVMNVYYLEALRCLNAMAKELGELLIPTEEIEKSYVNAFFDADKGLFKDREDSVSCSLPSNAGALFTGVAMNTQTKNNIIEMIREKRLNTTNLFFAPIIMLALKRCGEEELLHELLVDENAWLNMIKEGATTTFEAFSKEKKANASLFHPMFAFPILFLTDIKVEKYFEG